MKIWIVLPAYNEEKGLPPLLDSLIETFSTEKLQYEVIVVDDGSADKTLQVIKSYSDRFPVTAVSHTENSGLAETIKTGLLTAVKGAGDTDLILTMDADNTHPAGLALRMVRAIREGSDVVIASRYRDGSQVRGLALYRKFLSLGAAFIFRLLFPISGVRDYTCGYRVYRAKIIKDLIARYQGEFISERGFSCMVDILLRLRQFDLVFTEVPLILRYDKKQGASKMKVAQTVLDTLKLILKRRLSND